MYIYECIVGCNFGCSWYYFASGSTTVTFDGMFAFFCAALIITSYILPNDLGDVIPLDDMENMLKLMDLNNDGLVSFEEMLCCIAAIVYVQDDLIAEAYNARNIASFIYRQS